MPAEPYSETIPVPASVRFPVELEPPEGFRPEEPASWPRIDGRLEWVGGRLLYMPPCGAVQQGVSVGVVTILGQWGEEHPEFFVGGNEAGMILGKDVRGAEGAVWLALPKTLEVVVVTAAGETRHATGDRLPPHPALPGLEPAVERFFRQLDPPAS